MKLKILRSRGISLVELMIASAILGIIALAVAPMFQISQRAFTKLEAQSMMKAQGQEAINKIGHRLTECKRLFENSVNDNAFLARVQLGSAPAVMPNSVLPLSEETGSISPSSSAFVTASVGNQLFFASVLAPADLTVLDGGGVSRNVRIDQYQFNRYYLTLDAQKVVGGRSRRVLWEWHSRTYADYNQIMAIGNATKRNNTVSALVSSGVSVAWDPTVTAVGTAFYTLSAGGAIALQAGHNITGATVLPSKDMLKTNSGLTTSGYRFGISPNTTGGFSTMHAVPQFGAVNGNFPSGFEVVVVGPNSARQVFIRMVLAAEGPFPGAITGEQVLLTTSRDLW